MSAERPPTQGDLDETADQALAEMERCLRTGEPCDAAAFLDAHPDLASDPERAVDLLLREYFGRRQRGEALNPDEWFARFPRWRDLLQRRFQSLQTATDGAAPADPNAQTKDHVHKTDAGWDEAVPELGRHEVYEEVGRGAMGVVYRARDLVLNRPVALKMIAPRHGLLETPEAVRRFYREARAAARLRHPHIVPIHGMGLHQGRHCFTMPLLTGGTLARHMGDYRDDLAAAALMEKIARAVQYAHEQGVIHRDLKPGNILLDQSGEPMVADFGLAKLLDGDVDASTPGSRVGTPAYMSPEQAAGHTWKVSPKSDVWALGVILFELLTEYRPFPGRDLEGVYEQVLTAPTLVPRSLRPDLPPELEAVLLHCLEKDPEQRCPSAGELADHLGRWLRREPTRLAPPIPKRRFFRGPFAIACGALLLLAAGLTWLAVNFFKPARIDPDQALLAEEQTLADGQPVTVIGNQGPPRWQRWAFGGGTVNEAPEHDGVFTFEAFNPACLELLRNPRRSYCFSAEVRHEDTTKMGEVGLYCAYSFLPADDGDMRCLCGIAYNEFVADMVGPDDKPHANVRLFLRWYRDSSPDRSGTANLRIAFFPPGALPGAVDKPWRRLALEVTPEKVQGFWEGQSIGEISTDDLSTTFFQALRLQLVNGQLQNQCPNFQPGFDPRLPVGLFAANGKASFQKVVVRPLP